MVNDDCYNLILSCYVEIKMLPKTFHDMAEITVAQDALLRILKHVDDLQKLELTEFDLQRLQTIIGIVEAYNLTLMINRKKLANTRKVNGFHVFLLVSVLLMLVILVGCLDGTC